MRIQNNHVGTGLVAILSLFALVGCPDAGTVPTNDAAESTTDGSSTAEATPDNSGETTQSASTEVSLESLNPQDYQSLLAEHQGKVVVIDFWATWCAPCQASFPHTVEWSQTFDKNDVAVLSITIDEPDAQEAALNFLQDKQATFPNYISSVGAADEAFEAFDLDGGAVPHYKVYDREGQLLKKFGAGDPDNVFDHTDIEQAIREALGT